jgi:hypothetical protein
VSRLEIEKNGQKNTKYGLKTIFGVLSGSAFGFERGVKGIRWPLFIITGEGRNHGPT